MKIASTNACFWEIKLLYKLFAVYLTKVQLRAHIECTIHVPNRLTTKQFQIFLCTKNSYAICFALLWITNKSIRLTSRSNNH
ncbi:hypothetical protein BpHYR1_033648 [Brachionus plicatilis]|uniref:Uncharacterized protein n=1 Tax=Brachionus plicatilis TaxID=10195 RepID=A0A3M7PYJ7_BRAPC|nr:hypothetical protein BpHYR1_033648 [Brachionus plicatilis]